MPRPVKGLLSKGNNKCKGPEGHVGRQQRAGREGEQRPSQSSSGQARFSSSWETQWGSHSGQEAGHTGRGACPLWQGQQHTVEDREGQPQGDADPGLRS